MILQALVKYYEDLEKQGKLPRQGWCQAKVSYGINLSRDGTIKNIMWLKDEVQAGKKNGLDFKDNDSSGNAYTLIWGCS